MLPAIPKPAITSRQKSAALAVAGFIDLLQVVLLPSMMTGLDFPLDLVAVVALLAICGFKWQFILAFCVELMPVVGFFPTWTAVVLTIPAEAPAANDSSPFQRINVTTVPPPPPPQRYAGEDPNIVDVDAVVAPPVQPPPVRNIGAPSNP